MIKDKFIDDVSKGIAKRVQVLVQDSEQEEIRRFVRSWHKYLGDNIINDDGSIFDVEPYAILDGFDDFANEYLKQKEVDNETNI